KEMSSADSGEPNKLGTPDRPIESLVNVRYQAFRLPTGQLATESARCLRSALAFQPGCTQRRRTGQACLRSLMIELNLGLRYGEQLQQGRCQRNPTLPALFMSSCGQHCTTVHGIFLCL